MTNTTVSLHTKTAEMLHTNYSNLNVSFTMLLNSTLTLDSDRLTVNKSVMRLILLKDEIYPNKIMKNKLLVLEHKRS